MTCSFLEPSAQRIQALEPDTKDLTFKRLEEAYPSLYSTIAKEEKAASFAEVGPNPYKDIHDKLSAKIVGQNVAVDRLAETLTTQLRQDGNTNFLFVGPTGVGKTKLAKAVGAIKGGRFVEIAMNQYNTKEHSSNLFGTPTGVKGSEDLPHFIKSLQGCFPIKMEPEGETSVYEVTNAVVLFDELEKAHSSIKDTLLDLLDTGICTIKYTRKPSFSPGKNVAEKYVFKRCVFAGTSNLYQQMIVNALSQGNDATRIEDDFGQLNKTGDSPSNFSPEFLGRFSRNIFPLAQ